MDLFTDVCVYTLFLTYEIYASIIGFFAWLFMPITKRIINRLIKEKFGVEVNGPKPTDPQILDDNVYVRTAKYWAEGYCDGWVAKEFEAKDIQGLLEICIGSGRTKEMEHPLSNIIFKWFNLQTPRRAWEVGREHYDIGYDIWESMFGKTMQYSCGYWKDAKNLQEAQEAKLHLIAKKLQLKPGMKLLDIGSGWGGLSFFMATNYGVSVVGYTVSKEQKKYCEKLCAGLPCEFRLADYRTINEKFDAIVSVGMFEHVGGRNYGDYFKTANRALKDDGLFLLHTMGISHRSTPINNTWIHKHIFKNGYFPHHTEIAEATDGLFIIEDWHNMGYNYYLTYKAWFDNLQKDWPKLEPKYGEKFRRIWDFYLMMFMALWKTRKGQLWQVVLSKDGKKGGYQSVR